MDEFSKGIVFPLKGENIEKEKKIEVENHIQINFHLPCGNTEVMYEKASIEVGYLKLMLSKKLQKPYNQIKLTYNNNVMLDPLSIIDIIKEKFQFIDIDVNYID
ncbi:conserved Plasmodium protein, unknown function [Plasmodium gallinaceum]|uniref:Ubiquitin-like domain-containing protein n=1 Tax=Plasmodium gallinaceum TaxID=5849 RepID=A0A1J1H3I1_PLAGA|nr:conserved Plasmodium protein, unknown function [Plasmodium gallinaceum]CRG98047.1 conserved Plasmodium protein, unknown function [Plasmodium gallinaceum]